MQRDKDELFERLQRVEGGAAERDRELQRLHQENAALKLQLEEFSKVGSALVGMPGTLCITCGMSLLWDPLQNDLDFRLLLGS